MDTEIAFLDKLNIEKAKIKSFIKENRFFYEPYLDKVKGILKTYKSNDNEVFHSTSTAFAFYYISRILKLSHGKVPDSITVELEKLYEMHCRKLASHFIKEHSNNKITQTGKLPNNYNTPIQMLGILTSWEHIVHKNKKRNKLETKFEVLSA